MKKRASILRISFFSDEKEKTIKTHTSKDMFVLYGDCYGGAFVNIPKNVKSISIRIYEEKHG